MLSIFDYVRNKIVVSYDCRWRSDGFPLLEEKQNISNTSIFHYWFLISSTWIDVLFYFIVFSDTKRIFDFLFYFIVLVPVKKGDSVFHYVVDKELLPRLKSAKMGSGYERVVP